MNAPSAATRTRHQPSRSVSGCIDRWSRPTPDRLPLLAPPSQRCRALGEGQYRAHPEHMGMSPEQVTHNRVGALLLVNGLLHVVELRGLNPLTSRCEGCERAGLRPAGPMLRVYVVQLTALSAPARAHKGPSRSGGATSSVSGQPFLRIRARSCPCLVRARPLVIAQHHLDWLAAWLSAQDQTSGRKWDATWGCRPP